MKTLVSALRRSPAQTETPVPLAPRSGALGISGWAVPAGQEAQMAAMGSVGTLFAVAGGLAEDISHSAWHLYRKASKPGEERTEIFSHAAIDLWAKPNSFMPRLEFIETGQQHFELVGETWWVLTKIGNLPLEMWPVRPDRMIPVKHPQKFLTGYLYRSPDGELIPLDLGEVIQIRRPNPLDPYRGMGPVQALLAKLDAIKYSAEWNRNFFLNSAEPGGIIQTEKRLSDDEFEEMKIRWNEQHRGVNRAHRIAIIEQGQWIDRKYSMRDMQFAELADVNNASILQAYRYPKPMLGEVNDVNRANADAMQVIYGRICEIPRLERLKSALNNELMPMYGPSSDDLEWDYESPVEADWTADNADRQSRVDAAATLVGAGWDPAAALEWAGLPPMTWTEPRKVIPPIKEPGPPGATDRWQVPAWARPRAAAQGADEPDLSGVLDDLDAELAQLQDDYAPTVQQQTDDLADQTQTAVDDNADEQADDGGASEVLAALAVLALAAGALGTVTVTAAVERMATTAARRAVAEVLDAGVTVAWSEVERALQIELETLNAAAEAIVRLVADGVAGSAAREAVRLWHTGMTGTDLAAQIRDFLGGLTGADRDTQFDGLLHRTVNAARGVVFGLAAKLKTGMTITASEQNDQNTCPPCEAFDGHIFPTLTDAITTYAGGGYPDCKGGPRCRGTFYVSWSGR